MKFLSVILLLVSPVCFANEVRIVDVRVECSGHCNFTVTLEHALDGKLLGSRVLYHPHENEQPFTRSLAGVVIPAGLRQVKIRARDSLHGFTEQEVVVDIPQN